MGKTAFSLWLATGGANLDRPVLVCPAAVLDGARMLPELLVRILSPHLEQPVPADAILTWPLLVVFDGVNESLDMMRLIWQIDRALVDAGRLKVNLTFRPESFQIVRQALLLNRHCYYAEPLPNVLDALLCDRPAFRWLLFSWEELPRAYDLYRQAYRLPTSFLAIPAALKESLRHPLMLRLLAETCAGQSLPNAVDTDQLVQNLLDAFCAQGRLRRADILFLEEHLMPLMLTPGRWSNAFAIGDVFGTSSTWSDDGPASAQHSLTRLADVGLLAPTSGRLDDPIRFVHECFYEHFARRWLFRLRESGRGPAGLYADLADVPFLARSRLSRRLLTDVFAEAIRCASVWWWVERSLERILRAPEVPAEQRAWLVIVGSRNVPLEEYRHSWGSGGVAYCASPEKPPGTDPRAQCHNRYYGMLRVQAWAMKISREVSDGPETRSSLDQRLRPGGQLPPLHPPACHSPRPDRLGEKPSQRPGRSRRRRRGGSPPGPDRVVPSRS